MRNLEKDLTDNQFIKEKLRKDKAYATDMYRALSNVQWFYGDTELAKEPKKRTVWTCTWRYAGQIVANLRCTGEDYINFYCSGNEGIVSREVGEDLAEIGWFWQEWPKKDD
jgi:hypothetical protein